MRKLKKGMRESKLLWHEDLFRGSVSHKGTPTSTLLKHSQRVLLLGNQVSSKDTKSTVTLIPGSTKELLHQGRGSTRPSYKACWRCSTPSRRVVDVAGESPRLQGWPAHRVQAWAALNHSTQRHTTLLTHSRAKLALNLRMWSICSLVGLEMSLDACGSSLNSSNSKMAGVRRLYRPPSRTSRFEPLPFFLRRRRIIRPVHWSGRRIIRPHCDLHNSH